MDAQSLIPLLSAAAASLSFVAFALPFLNRTERKERYQEIIQKKRRALLEAAKDPSAHVRKPEDKQVSARESVATFFMVQKLVGALGEKMRDQMLQAGIRDPKAPLLFLIARILLPLLFMGISGLMIAASDREISASSVFWVLLAAAFAGYFLPRVLIKNHIIKRQKEINITFPDALDMMLICIQGGIGLEQTINRVADEISEYSPILAEELGILSAELGMLNDRRGALQDFARRVGSGAAKTFASTLVQAEQYGTSVSKAIRVMAEELRQQRMAEAERKAHSLPPKLTVPMIVFILPALFIVILGPAGIKASAAGIGGG